MKYFSFLACLCITTTLFSQASFQPKTPTKKELILLKNQLENILKKDQAFRRIYVAAENELGENSFEMGYFWKVVEAQDKVLEKAVTDILDNYGWLGILQVGRLANTAQWAVLQHGTIVSKEKYAPLLKESVFNNESQGIHYARLIDRMLVNTNKPQSYGTQIKYNNNNPTFYAIRAPDFINKRRKEIGLNSIQEFAKSKKIEWTITQK